jgi:hypothetical protein
VRLAVDVIVPAVAGGITTRRDHHQVTAAASDPFTARAEELQYGVAEGPCLDALGTGQVLQPQTCPLRTAGEDTGGLRRACHGRSGRMLTACISRSL